MFVHIFPSDVQLPSVVPLARLAVAEERLTGLRRSAFLPQLALVRSAPKVFLAIDPIQLDPICRHLAFA